MSNKKRKSIQNEDTVSIGLGNEELLQQKYQQKPSNHLNSNINWISVEKCFHQLISQHRDNEAFHLIESILSMRPLPMKLIPSILRLLIDKDLDLYNSHLRDGFYFLPKILKQHKNEAPHQLLIHLLSSDLYNNDLDTCLEYSESLIGQLEEGDFPLVMGYSGLLNFIKWERMFKSVHNVNKRLYDISNKFKNDQEKSVEQQSLNNQQPQQIKPNKRYKLSNDDSNNNNNINNNINNNNINNNNNNKEKEQNDKLSSYFDRAYKRMSLALQTIPTLDYLITPLCKLTIFKKDKKKCDQLLKEFLLHNPTNPNSYLLYGSFLYEFYYKERQIDITQCFLQLVKLDPMSNYAMATLSEMYIKNKIDITTMMDIYWSRFQYVPFDLNIWHSCANNLFQSTILLDNNNSRILSKKAKIIKNYKSDPKELNNWDNNSKIRFLTLFNSPSIDSLNEQCLVFKILIYYIITKNHIYITELFSYLSKPQIKNIKMQMKSIFKLSFTIFT